VFCSFLALIVRKELEARSPHEERSWNGLTSGAICAPISKSIWRWKARGWLLRTKVRGVCHRVLQAAGVAVPPTVRN
jgi:hypothetical protein